MLTELCQYLHNWFDYARVIDTFTIKDGKLTGVKHAQDGQYIRICDSMFNDGVYQYPGTGLKDETFDGVIWLMKVPQGVIALSKEIDEWKEKYADVLHSPFQSESFGGYSYSKAAGSGGSGSTSWQDEFANQLDLWRKLP